MSDAGHERIALPGGPYTACLFDMDGVLTDTASVHAGAWKRTFDELLQRRAAAEGSDFVEFSIAGDYVNYVDGKPRNNGVRDFLLSRGIDLPEGDPNDPPGDATVWAVGNRKNELLLQLLDQGGVEVYEGSVRFVKAARAEGMKTAVVSSSANTEAVLKAVGLTDQFDERVDGVTIIKERLSGKPAPDTFLLAAERLGVAPRQAAVFEDALSGVAAGRAGKFGLVVGVDRVGQAAALKENGAEIVVEDLAEFLWQAEPSAVKNERP